MTDPRKRLEALYEYFNARDMESVLAQFHPDIEWPNAWEGGYVRGHDGVRDYWTRQWAAISPTVEPVAVSPQPDGSIRVDVHQTVRNRDGAVVSETQVTHLYTFENGLIRRMELA